MKRIYICAPYSVDIEKKRWRALGYARRVKDAGHLPFCPHLYFDAFCDEETERELIMDYCREEIRRSDEVWVFGDKLTDGMFGSCSSPPGEVFPSVSPSGCTPMSYNGYSGDIWR